MLVDNRKIIKETNSVLFEKILLAENQIQNFLLVEPAKKLGETLAVKEKNSYIYIHSKYNPLNEASSFAEGFTELDNPEHLLFIGVGIGYHVIEILEKYPNTTFSIFEPNIHILSVFLQKQNLSKLKAKLKGIFITNDEIQSFYKSNKKYLSTLEIIHWPITNKLYHTEISSLEEHLKQILKTERESKEINAVHQKRWQMNGIINFPKILKSPHFFDLDLNDFENKPAIIVAAGPSLSLDIHLLKEIKDKRKAYIFAVGSAINALIENDILPDLFISFDPQVTNQNVVKKLKEKKLPIPMLFGSTIGFETLIDYPGPLIHFFVERELISKYFLDIKDEHIFVDKPSVSIMAVEFCRKLKMGPIILAGQNCAYFENKRYSDGVGYTHLPSEVSNEEMANKKQVESVDGDIIYTNDTYLLVKRGFDLYLKQWGLKNIINTTKHGAKIEGAPYRDLEEILLDELSENNVVNFNLNLVNNTYDLNKVKSKYQKLEKSFDELLINLKAIDQVMASIIDKNNTRVYKNVNDLLLKYDSYYDVIHENLFYKVIIENLVQIQREKFLTYSSQVSQAKNERLKIEKFINIHVPYIRAIFANIVYVQKAFKEFKQIKDF